MVLRFACVTSNCVCVLCSAEERANVRENRANAKLKEALVSVSVTEDAGEDAGGANDAGDKNEEYVKEDGVHVEVEGVEEEADEDEHPLEKLTYTVRMR